jgi:hypothetical protein
MKIRLIIEQSYFHSRVNNSNSELFAQVNLQW